MSKLQTRGVSKDWPFELTDLHYASGPPITVHAKGMLRKRHLAHRFLDRNHYGRDWTARVNPLPLKKNQFTSASILKLGWKSSLEFRCLWIKRLNSFCAKRSASRATNSPKVHNAYPTLECERCAPKKPHRVQNWTSWPGRLPDVLIFSGWLRSCFDPRFPLHIRFTATLSCSRCNTTMIQAQ